MQSNTLTEPFSNISLDDMKLAIELHKLKKALRLQNKYNFCREAGVQYATFQSLMEKFPERHISYLRTHAQRLINLGYKKHLIFRNDISKNSFR
jgi:hypothetical protein